MMKRLGILALVLCSIVAVAEGPLDDLSATVVLLAGQVPETAVIDGITYEIGLRKPGDIAFVPRLHTVTGTGLLVVRSSRLYLVTASHVAKAVTPDSQVTVRTDLTRPSSISMREFSGWQSQLRWHFHSNADVAALALKPTPQVLALLNGHFLPDSAFDPSVPSRDVPLVVLGFPFGLGGSGVFSPLSRETKAASGLLTDASGTTFFVLQDPSVGGYSGAPVFDLHTTLLRANTIIARGGSPTCVGLAVGTFSDDTGGKFASVVPASTVLTLLEEQ